MSISLQLIRHFSLIARSLFPAELHEMFCNLFSGRIVGRRSTIVMRLILLIVFLIFAPPLSAETIRSSCQDSEVTVVADTRDINPVCDAVTRGAAFLRSLDLELPENLTITVCKEPPQNGQLHSVGYYDARSNEIQLLDYDTALNASRQFPPIFGIPMSPVIWRSTIIHELAHAAAQRKFASGITICTAHEYIAAIVQISTLPKDEREEIFRNNPGLSGFDRKEEISMTYYLIDPTRFMLNAYLHYEKPENGLKFIHQLLCEGLPDN